MDGRDKTRKSRKNALDPAFWQESLHPGLRDLTRMKPVPRRRNYYLYDADLQPHPSRGQHAAIGCRRTVPHMPITTISPSREGHSAPPRPPRINQPLPGIPVLIPPCREAAQSAIGGHRCSNRSAGKIRLREIGSKRLVVRASFGVPRRGSEPLQLYYPLGSALREGSSPAHPDGPPLLVMDDDLDRTVGFIDSPLLATRITLVATGGRSSGKKSIRRRLRRT